MNKDNHNQNTQVYSYFKLFIITIFLLVTYGCSSDDDQVALNSRIIDGQVILGSDPIIDSVDATQLKKLTIVTKKNQLKPVDKVTQDDLSGESSKYEVAKASKAGQIYSLDKPYQSIDEDEKNENIAAGSFSSSNKDNYLKSSTNRASLRADLSDLNKYLLSRINVNKQSDDHKKIFFHKRKLLTLMDLYAINLDKVADSQELALLSKYVKGAIRGNVEMQSRLADFYLDGLNGESYEELAAAWYLLAANNNSTYARYMLSILYQQGVGLDQNLSESVYWYKLASDDKDSAKAKVNVAKRYLVPYSIIHDPKQAAIWMEAAAVQNNVEAQYLLADMYLQGRGIQKSEMEALKWYGKAASVGSAYAQYSLGVMYYNGQGVEQNLQEANKWLTYAAFQSHTEAQYLLGRMYEQGFGVEKSLPKAYAWWTLVPQDEIAVDDFESNFNDLVANMTSEEKIQAENLKTKYSKKIATS